MKREKIAAIIGIFLTISTVMSLCLCFIDAPATAASTELAGYFQINYDPAVFSKTEILGNEVFTGTIHGNATCIKDPPVHPTKGRITGNITAVHSVSGSQVILQTTYTVNIGNDSQPFPSHLGDHAEMTVTVPLQFPAHGEGGEYIIVAKTVKAEIYFLGGWSDVTDMVPASKTLGILNYTPAPVVPGTSSTPTPTAAPTPTPVLPASKLFINLWGTNVSGWRIDGGGFLLENVKANSSDGSISINIPANTKALGADTEPLASIIIAPSNTALTPGKGYRVVAAYDCLPDGASFAPAIELTLAYDPDDLPAGAFETNLKIAHFDKAHPDGEMFTGDLAIDTDNHTVTFHTGHFSDFAVLAPAGDTSGANTSIVPLIIALGLIALGLILILMVVIRKRRLSR